MTDGKSLKNKQIKLKKLYDAAYDLFIDKGVQETVIDDIVRKAGVAKGTFYLYFKDKYDLIDKMVIRKSSIVMEETFQAVKKEKEKNPRLSFEEEIILFIDYLIDFFKKNKELLAIIHKNLSKGLFREAFANIEMIEPAKAFIENFSGSDRKSAQHLLYIVVEMVGSVCYSAIVQEEPYTIEEIKPTLFSSVEKILK